MREPRIDGCEDWPIPFGKHKGTRLADLEIGYLEWLVDNLTSERDIDLYTAICHIYSQKKNNR